MAVAVGGEASRHDWLALVYVTPALTQQFVSLSDAADFVKCHVELQRKKEEEEEKNGREKELSGGYWRLGYVVHAFTAAAAESESCVAPPRTGWCFTLEPLPAEQLAACRMRLTSVAGTSASSPSIESRHHPHAHSPLLKSTAPSDSRTHLHHSLRQAEREHDLRTLPFVFHDLLTTPLYVCTRAEAVVELPGSLSLLLSSLSHAAAAGRGVGTLDASLQALLQAVPSRAALVYTLRQRHCFQLPLLPLVGPLNASEREGAEEEEEGCSWPAGGAAAAAAVSPAVELYVALGGAQPQEAAEVAGEQEKRQKEGAVVPTPCGPLVHVIQARAARRWGSQTVLFNEGNDQAGLRLRRMVVEELCRSAPCTPPSLLPKLQAALRILDALTPSGPRNSAVVVHALDLFLQRIEPPTPRATTEETPSQLLRVVGGRVRRVVAEAGAYTTANAPSSVSEVATAASAEEGLVPETDVLALSWLTSNESVKEHDEAGPTEKQPASWTRMQSRPASYAPPPSSPMTYAEREACMQALGMPDELRTHVHDLTQAIVLLASLTFTTRRGTAGSDRASNNREAALLATACVPVCETASRLLRLSSPLELVQVLTMVDVRSGSGSGTVRHALNCAGACQLQSVLVAHLGGLLVRTLLHAVNCALQDDVQLRHETQQRQSSETSAPSASVVSLVVGSNVDAECEEASKQSPDSESGGGLRAWYSAYARCRVTCAVCAGLVGRVRQEAQCEGVEREVDTWIDTLASRARDASDTGADVATAIAEAAALAQHVPLSDVLPGDGDGGDAAPAPRSVERLAAAINAVVDQCSDDDTNASVSTVAAVQELLQSALKGLMDEDDGEDEGGDDEMKKSSGMPSRQDLQRRPLPSCVSESDVKVVWSSVRSSREACACGDVDATPDHKSGLLVSSKSGLCPPLHLSLPRLAADLLSSVRLRKIGATAAVQSVMTAVAVRSASLVRGPAAGITPHDDLTSDLESASVSCTEGRPARRTADVPQRFTSAADALVDALTLQPPRKGPTPLEGQLHPALRSLTVVQTIPVSAAQWTAAASISRIPFLEPVFPLSTASIAHDDSTGETVDDAAMEFVWRREPLLLALFFWNRLCHSQVCPVGRFGKEWAVPLLIAWALHPASSTSCLLPSTLGEAAPTQRALCVAALSEEGTALLRRVHALRSQARYRELTLLALTTIVPLGRTVVLGVSCVFFSAATAEAMARWRAALQDAAARRVQSAGRGWQVRRRLALAAQPCNKSAESAMGQDRGRTSTAPAQQQRVLTPAQLRERAVLEQQREDALRETSHQLTATLRGSADHLCNVVCALQQRWTTTLELLEGELVGATAEINRFETQRRAAEDASRQEARTRARVTEEAWADVWTDERQRQQHRRTAQLKERQREQRSTTTRPSREASDAALLHEEERVARITMRHLAELRRSATQCAEAAVLARAVAQQQAGDAKWLQQHVARQERRLAREAEQREQQQEQYSLDIMDAVHGEVGAERAVVTPVRGVGSAPPASTLLQYSDARGLVFTRPRPISGAAARRSAQLGRIRAFSPTNMAEKKAGSASFTVSIDRTAPRVIATSGLMTDDDGDDWEVQRDLMSLWESSQVTT